MQKGMKFARPWWWDSDDFLSESWKFGADPAQHPNIEVQRAFNQSGFYLFCDLF